MRLAIGRAVPSDRDRADARSPLQLERGSKYDQCDGSRASDHATCFDRLAAAEALPSLIRYILPFPVGSDTRLSPSFLRTTPARNPRTECCCQPIAVMIVAIVAPAGARSIATIRLCLVSGRDADLDEAGANCLRGAGLAVLRAFGRVAAFGLDLGFMGFSEVHAAPSGRTTSAPPGQITRQGRTRKPVSTAPRHHNNAPIATGSQSFLSKIVARWVAKQDAMVMRSFESSRPSRAVEPIAVRPQLSAQRPANCGPLQFGSL